MKAFILFCLMACFTGSVFTDEKPVEEVEAVVRSIYQLISVEAGRVHQLDAFTALWHEKAHFAFPNPDGSFRFQSFPEFEQQLRTAVIEGELGEAGFREEVVDISVSVYGKIARASVHYRLYSPADADVFTREGIDMIQLIKTKEGWKIFSLVNQISTEETGSPALSNKY
jgi:hypothetical protein